MGFEKNSIFLRYIIFLNNGIILERVFVSANYGVKGLHACRDVGGLVHSPT